MTPQIKSIIAHITPVGWIIALIINSSEKDELTSFYIRQTLGLFIASIVFAFIPIIGWILDMVVFALWIISLIGAIQEQQKPIPIVGQYFQDWFKGL